MLLIFFWHPITALVLYWKNEKFHCSLKTLNGHSRNQQISNVADSFSGIPEYSRKMTYLRFTRILRLTLSSDAWGKTFCVEIYVTKNTFESGRCFSRKNPKKYRLKGIQDRRKAMRNITKNVDFIFRKLAIANASVHYL